MKQRTSHAQAISFIWTYVRHHLPWLFLMFIILIVSTSSLLAQPFFYKAAIDAIAKGNPSDPAVANQAMWSVALGILFAGIAVILEQIGHLILGWVESAIMIDMESDVFAKTQRLSTDFHVNEFAGATARKIGRGVEAVETVMDKIWFNFLPTAVLMIGFLIVLLNYSAPIGITLLIGMVISIALAVFFNGFLGRLQSWVDQQDTIVSANMVDAITSNAVVKSFSAEEHEDARHRKGLLEWRRRIWKSWTSATAVTIFQYTLLLVIELCVLFLAVYLWRKGEFTAGGFVVVILYVTQVWGRLWDMGRNLQDYRKAVAHAEEMIVIANQSFAVSDQPDAKILKVDRGEVELRNVRFGYEKKTKTVFEDFSVTINPGEKVALVGHSGGGKSSLVKLLLRLYDVQSGSVQIDGQDIRSVTQASLRAAIALVPQEPLLFHRSIADNIRYGRPDASQAEVERAAKLAHAHEFIETLPKRYETEVGERGVKLSGGERQRIAIARALLADRPILILDEATSSLDSLSEKYIQEALATLMQGRTTIVIAHRLSTIKRVDRILVIENGRIMEQGSHAELLQKENGIYKNLYELQAGGFLGE